MTLSTSDNSRMPNDAADLDTATFGAFRELIHRVSGIHLGDAKRSLVRSRIARRMRELGLERPRDYLDRVGDDRSGREISELVDAISTNVTSFFREPAHFELAGSWLQRWRSRGDRRLRIWSAACSTGQEPYSIAMLVRHVLPDPRDCRILATDLNSRVLQRCRDGVYSGAELDGLDTSMRRRFLQQERGTGDQWRMTEPIREMVTVRRLNLAHPPFPLQGPFDMIFCRNVMIYFDRPVRQRLLRALVELLAPGGLLFVGHAESLAGYDCGLRSVQPTVYERRGGA